MATVSGAPSADQQSTYRELLAAVRACRLTAAQIEALCSILLHLNAAAELLAEADAPDAPRFKRQDYYAATIAETTVAAFRRALGALADPPTSPARFDTGQSFAGGAESRLAQPSRSDAVGGLDAVPDAQDARPVAEGAEPQPAHLLDHGATRGA